MQGNYYIDPRLAQYNPYQQSAHYSGDYTSYSPNAGSYYPNNYSPGSYSPNSYSGNYYAGSYSPRNIYPGNIYLAPHFSAQAASPVARQHPLPPPIFLPGISEPTTIEGTTYYPLPSPPAPSEESSSPQTSQQSTPSPYIIDTLVTKLAYRYFQFIENDHKVHLWISPEPYLFENSLLFNCEVSIINPRNSHQAVPATLSIAHQACEENSLCLLQEFFTTTSFKKRYKKNSPFSLSCFEITSKEVLKQIGTSRAFIYQRHVSTLDRAIAHLAQQKSHSTDLSENLRTCKHLITLLNVLHRSGNSHGRLCPQAIGIELSPEKGQDIYTYSERLYFLNPMRIIESTNLEVPPAYKSHLSLNQSTPKKEDIWSLCCVLFEVLTGQVLFPIKQTEELCPLLAQRIATSSHGSHLEFALQTLQRVYVDAPQELINNALALLEKGLSLDPSAEVSCQDLLTFFEKHIESRLQARSHDKLQLLKKGCSKEEILQSNS